jgi:alanine dehydrogenase
MPGAVARTSTFALNNVTLPFATQLANKGAKAALMENIHLLRGLNVYREQITYKAVADDQRLPYVAPEKALGA